MQDKQVIYVEISGNGFPLVLVHGFLGSSSMWLNQKIFFEKNFKVITPNLPGFGLSQNVTPAKSIEEMANTIIEYLNKNEINKFNLLGHSMGGMIVQEMANKVGDKIEKLICFATGAIGEMPDRFETIDQSRDRFKKLGKKSTAISIAKTWFVEGDQAKFFYLCEEAGNQANELAIDQALIAMKNWNGLKKLINIKNKTLIIWGDKDRSYNFFQVDTLNKNISNSRLEVMTGCAHNAHLENPELFNSILNEFLNK